MKKGIKRIKEHFKLIFLKSKLQVKYNSYRHFVLNLKIEIYSKN